ncbi:MAG: hypothetical protein COV29_02345 [Candidatus Yanofskybacteria bacterium CG10_big_fil_rev_8_21_14_0_10_36_16]|uniref:Glycosyltransferase RgtA/B/C/D-like domain-containing protein n=1 Tax=Candidatus Yanofskybacteria bacterium CG10_big_fil_rev_8_21_14_0_10_36_16 TaxID=1975096 RepID=A0A2J0Q7N6_9BACT|nr:MAG: hypothetical protein COV29_02345 [Candidatus Yanofskybacteria bacterium CG10_big_fil_rev_8_21_14_0_10_36_16]
MRREWIIILIILAIACFSRLWHLDLIPPSLSGGEAVNANDATKILDAGKYNFASPETSGQNGLYTNFVAGSFYVFGKSAWAMRLVSAIAGILTVWGLFLLTKIIFGRTIGFLASFMLATSFWHINFSRIGFGQILEPLLLVFALYFLWHGLRNHHVVPFFISGIFWGLGFYTHVSFRIMPILIVILIWAYLHYAKKHNEWSKYQNIKQSIKIGATVMAITAFTAAFPIIWNISAGSADFAGHMKTELIFGSENLLSEFLNNIGKTLTSFNFKGDQSWLHNFSGSPLLLWPIGAFFVVGLIRSIFKCIRMKRQHGHWSTAQTLMLSWFMLGMLPSFFVNDAPNSLWLLIVAPVVYIFAAEGMWWFYELLSREYEYRDSIHKVRHMHRHLSESSIVAGFAIIVLLSAIAFVNSDKYLNKWANHTEVYHAFNQTELEIAQKINRISPDVKKYILVNSEDEIIVDGLPLPAQTVMFFSDTATEEKQKTKNVFYLTEKEFTETKIERDALIIPLRRIVE